MERYKARLFAKHYSQQEHLHYHDTFSHVTKMGTMRCIIALVVSKYWNSSFQIDVYNVLIQGYIDEELYMDMPKSFKKP